MVDDMVDGGFDKYDLIIYHYLNWEIGWTVWLERKIMSKIKNDPSYEYFSASIGYKVRWEMVDDDMMIDEMMMR